MGRAGQGVFGLKTAVAIAALVQALLFVTFPPELTPDSADYLAQAEAWVGSGEARDAAGEPDTKRTPGYPLFLAVFLATSLGVPAAMAAQRVLWIALVAATVWLCLQGLRHRAAALVAGLVVALDLPALQAAGAVLTETLATVVVAAATWQAYRAGTTGSIGMAVAAGLLAGAAAMVRPVAILMGVPLALAILAGAGRPVRWRLAIVLLAASLMLPAAWTVRNYAPTGVATFSSISSINLLLYRAAGTLAIRDPGGIDANLGARQEQLEREACARAEAAHQRACASLSLAVRATYYDDVALPVILGDPVATLQQGGRGLVMIVFGGGASMLARLTGLDESMARVVAFGYTVPLALLALAGARHWWRADRLAASLLVLTVAYFVAMSLGAEAYSRFRVPFLPLYALLAAGGVAAFRPVNRA